MKKLVRKIVVVLIALISVGFYNVGVKAQSPTDLLRILSLRTSVTDKQVTIYWSTNFKTTGRIDYGISNGFGNWVTDNTLSQYHETVIGNLANETTYYYMLTVETPDGHLVHSDTYPFKTTKANDHQAPAVSHIYTSLITGNTVTIVWQTDEPGNSCIHYGTDSTKLTKQVCQGSQVSIHDVTITNLTRNTTYYYQVSSKDKNNNTQYSITNHFTTNFNNDADEGIPELIIYELTPFNQAGAEDATDVVVTIKTNRPVGGTLNYGTKSKSYPTRVTLPAPRDTTVELTLEKLKPDTLYYYKLSLKDVLNKTLDTPELTFKTLPKNILTAPGNTSLPTEQRPNPMFVGTDTDHDGLPDDLEAKIGTDPINPDTDRDNYTDGVEVTHGYNPLGKGLMPAWLKDILAGGYAYGLPRLKSLATEQVKAKELYNSLNKYFNGRIPKTKLTWSDLVKAYVYGGYPVDVIEKALKSNIKNINLTIPYKVWKANKNFKLY